MRSEVLERQRPSSKRLTTSIATIAAYNATTAIQICVFAAVLTRKYNPELCPAPNFRLLGPTRRLIALACSPAPVRATPDGRCLQAELVE